MAGIGGRPGTFNRAFRTNRLRVAIEDPPTAQLPSTFEAFDQRSNYRTDHDAPLAIAQRAACSGALMASVGLARNVRTRRPPFAVSNVRITAMPIDTGVRRALRSPSVIRCLRCGRAALGQRNKRYCTVACARLAWGVRFRQAHRQAVRGQHGGSCRRCGAAFVGQINKRYCSRTCSLAAYRQAHHESSRRWSATYRKRYPERVKQQERTAYPRRKDYQRAWREQNRDRQRMYGRDYRNRYPGRTNEAQRRSYSRHAEKRRAENVRWRKENPDKHAFIGAARRARALAAPGTHTYQEWLDLVARYERRCAYCGISCDRLTRDHIVPLRLGGGNEIANILPACRPCNSRKGLAPLAVFKARLQGGTEN